MKQRQFSTRPKTNKQMMLKLNQQRRITAEGCWLWTGLTNKQMYGKVQYKGVSWRVHRLAFYLYKPEEYEEFGMICHKCNTPRCFNPEHLYCGDNSTNQQDAVLAGTHSQASKTHCPRGHSYEDGGRHCKICLKIRNDLRAVWS